MFKMTAVNNFNGGRNRGDVDYYDDDYVLSWLLSSQIDVKQI